MKNLPPLEKLHSLFYIDDESVLKWKINPLYKPGFVGKPVGTKNRGYLEVKLDQTRYFVHRIMFFMYYEVDPGDQYVDHVDGDRSNNKKENLRLSSHTENCQNVKNSNRNRLGLRGVRKKRNRFSAAITVSGQKIHLGVFDTPEEAHLAYREASLKHFQEFSPYWGSDGFPCPR